MSREARRGPDRGAILVADLRLTRTLNMSTRLALMFAALAATTAAFAHPGLW